MIAPPRAAAARAPASRCSTCRSGISAAARPAPTICCSPRSRTALGRAQGRAYRQRRSGHHRRRQSRLHGADRALHLSRRSCTRSSCSIGRPAGRCRPPCVDRPLREPAAAPSRHCRKTQRPDRRRSATPTQQASGERWPGRPTEEDSDELAVSKRSSPRSPARSAPMASIAPKRRSAVMARTPCRAATGRPPAWSIPASTADVQAIVRSGEHASRCRSIRSAPATISGSARARRRRAGQVVVDLGRKMNRILDIDEKLAFAVVEPGVSYQALYDELVRRGNKLMLDVTSGPPQGGMIGNALDKGAGYTPYFDHFGFSCGLEIVLGNGEVLRTGDGALDCKDADQLAHLEIQLRTDPRRPVHAIEFRHRHPHGRVAVAAPAGGALVPLRLSRRRRSRNDRRALPAAETVEFRADVVSRVQRSLSVRLGRREPGIPSERRQALDLRRGPPAVARTPRAGAWNVSGAFYGPSAAAIEPQIQRVRDHVRAKRARRVTSRTRMRRRSRRCRSRSTPSPACRAWASSAC